MAAPVVATGPVTVLLYTTTSLPLWWVVAGCITMGTGTGIAYPRLSSAALALADIDEQGTYSSALQAGESMSVGTTIAVTAVVLTSALSIGASFALVYATLAGFACLAIVIGSLGGSYEAAERA